MKINNFRELVCTREEYELLKTFLEAEGVNLNWSSSDGNTYNCYVHNNYKSVVDGWGNDLEKKLAKEFFDRDNK